MRHDGKKDSDMRHGFFLNSTCDVVENKRQRHVTLPFSRNRHATSGAPIKGTPAGNNECPGQFYLEATVSPFSNRSIDVKVKEQFIGI